MRRVGVESGQGAPRPSQHHRSPLQVRRQPRPRVRLRRPLARADARQGRLRVSAHASGTFTTYKLTVRISNNPPAQTVFASLRTHQARCSNKSTAKQSAARARQQTPTMNPRPQHTQQQKTAPSSRFCERYRRAYVPHRASLPPPLRVHRALNNTNQPQIPTTKSRLRVAAHATGAHPAG